MPNTKGELRPEQLRAELDALIHRITIVRMCRQASWSERLLVEPTPVDEDHVRFVVLLLAAGSAIDCERFDSALSGVSRYGLCADSVAAVVDADVVERLQVFHTIRNLVEEGLVNLDAWGRRDEPRSFALASISITTTGMRALGLAENLIPRLAAEHDQDDR